MTPTPATYRRRKSRLPTMLLAIAAVSVVAIGAIVLAWQLGWAAGGTTPAAASSPTGKALSAETQIECTSIRREHENWAKQIPRLKALTPTGLDNRYWLTELKEDGDAYHKTVTGYPDQASKELAVAVSQYNYDLSLVSLEQQLGGKFNTDKHDKAVHAANALTASYDTFMARTCK